MNGNVRFRDGHLELCTTSMGAKRTFRNKSALRPRSLEQRGYTSAEAVVCTEN